MEIAMMENIGNKRDLISESAISGEFRVETTEHGSFLNAIAKLVYYWGRTFSQLQLTADEVASNEFRNRFVNAKENDEKYNSFRMSPSNEPIDLNTGSWNCLADFIGTSQYWRGNINGETEYLENTNLNELIGTTATREIGGIEVLHKFVDFKYGLNLFLNTKKCSLGKGHTFSEGNENMKNAFNAEIDEGRPVLVHLKNGDTVLGVGTSTTGGVIIKSDMEKYLNVTSVSWGEVKTISIIKIIEGSSAPPPLPFADITVMTNGSVRVGAVFGDVAQKYYSFDKVNWMFYKEPVTVNKNRSVYFKSEDSYGNTSEVAEYVVSNIDRTAPVDLPPERPVAVANITKATNKNVTVTATFDSKSKIKLYKVGNGAWKTYKSPVEMKNNGMVYFRAADSAGNLSLVNSFRVNNIDRTAPVISKITAVAQNSTAALNISFKPDNSGISHCEITCGKKKMTIYPSGNLSANLSANLTGLAIGRHTVSVVVYDLAGNKSRTKRLSFTVKDVTPPSKVATLYAPTVTNKYKGTFKWAAATDNSGKIAKYEIQLDNGKIYTSTKTSVSISKLTVGNHTYRVRAIDKDKNVGAWSAVKSFTVKDYTAPKISKLTATVKGYTATLKITATDNVKATKYVISYGKKSQTVTTNTATLTGLAVGKVAVSVVAYDAAGNKSAAKKINLTVKDSTPPSKVATLYAPSVTNKYKGTFKWGAATDNSGKIAKYEIQLDNGKIYTSTKTTLSVSNLKVGKHTYRVRAIDKNKNAGAWSAVKSFTVKDMTAPATVSLSAKVSGNNATLTWKKPKDNVGVTKYVLKYGNKSVTLSGSATKYVIYGLNKGTYSYSMIAYDAAGNASKAKTGKITIKQPLAPARAAEALYAADFAAPEALFAPQTDILAYCNDLQGTANLSDSAALTADKKEERSLLAALS